MLFFRGRGRNVRLLTAAALFTLTLCFLEYDSILMRTGDKPQYIIIRNDFGITGDENKYQNCSEKTNFVYIKMIKCASTTLTAIFRRYGHSRDLSFVLPLDQRIYLGWPFEIQDDFYRPEKSKEFNVLVDHVVYNQERLAKVMPNATVYITSIREPFSQFKSMFHYYNVKNITRMKSENPIHEYLHHLEHWESIYKSPDSSKLRHCVPDGFSMSKNLMSFNLGFPTGFQSGTSDRSQDASFIESWIKSLNDEFSLVLISEYLQESLVLLRRLMCWTLGDIVYYSLNVGVYDYKQDHDESLVNIYKNWSNVDYILYNHFNQTLWKKLANQGADFWREVQYFKKIIAEVSRFCSSFPNVAHGETTITNKKRKPGHPQIILTVEESAWNPEFLVTEASCKLMQDENLLLSNIKKAYDSKEPALHQPVPSMKFC